MQTETRIGDVNLAAVTAASAVQIGRLTQRLQHCMSADLADTACSSDPPKRQ